MDGGVNWQSGFLPFTPQANPFAPNDPSQVVWPSECEDGVAAFGPDGTLYTGGGHHHRRAGRPRLTGNVLLIVRPRVACA